MEGDGDRVGGGVERHCYSADTLSRSTCKHLVSVEQYGYDSEKKKTDDSAAA